jgi:hypothetical protein
MRVMCDDAAAKAASSRRMRSPRACSYRLDASLLRLRAASNSALQGGGSREECR